MPFQDTALEKDMYAGIVTSLCFFNDSILLAGHGPYLRVYNVQSGQLLTSKLILPANRIHRIVFAPGPSSTNAQGNESRQLAVFGSKYLSLLTIAASATKAAINVEQSFGPFKDWIMDAQWMHGTTHMALVYGHNDVEIVDLTTRQVVYHVQCAVKCILYSARIFGSTPDTLIVASGTVFNEVHLWKPYQKQEDQQDAPVYKKLTGHEGVIFGMRFNDDASQLVSVSDDRTIRVWPLTDDDRTASPLVLFGHTARVWDCQFVDDYLVSISEDASCRVWKNTLLATAAAADDDDDGTGDCIACWEGHASKNVWSCAINPEHKIVATGGQDSGIRLWSLLSIQDNKIDSEDDLVSFPLPEERQRDKDTIRNFVMIKNRWIVAATLQGYLLKCDGAATTPHVWTEIQHDVSYKNYAIMKNSACGRVVVVGNIVGELVFLSPTDAFAPFKMAAHKQKLFEIFIEPSSSDANVLYVISNGYNDSVLFHRLDLSTLVPTVKTLFNIEMPAERTTVLSLAYSEEENILICGSRESALLIYRLPCHAIVPEGTIQTLKPTLQLRKSHGKQAITSVLIKQTSDADDTQQEQQDDITAEEEQEQEQGQEGHQLVFYTAGRDGCYVQYRLTVLHASPTHQVHDDKETQLGIANQGDTVFAGNDLILEKLYRNKITKGTLEGSMMLDGELLLMGFYRKHFFVYNENKNFSMVAIHCGGGHRRWGFSTQDAKLNASAFAFIRKEVLYAYFRDTSSATDGFKESILQSNYHGREVRALRFLPSSLSASAAAAEGGGGGGGALLFATGGEDTILRIQQYAPHSNASKVHTHVSIRKHTTVIKNIDCSQGLSTLLFTSGGLEEFRCWKIEASPSSSADNAPVRLNCLEVATCPTLSVDIESRIMDTTAFAISPSQGLHIIGAVYSDAMIRFWMFNEVTRKFCLVADGTWHAKCILQITHVQVGGKVYFLTSATDGRIAVWDIHDDLYAAVATHDQLEAEPTKAAFRLSEPAFYYSAHMSGVNALEAVPYQDQQHMLVLTGGEDNAVSAALLQVTATHVILVGAPFVLPDAHASSVTGIKYMDQSVFTTSTDQRLNKWQVNKASDGGVSLSMTDAAYMDVPDPSALDAVEFNGQVHVAITGVGLQSVKYASGQ